MSGSLEIAILIVTHLDYLCISEAVRIEHAIRDVFIVSNEKSEWHSASLVSIASEVQTDVRRNPGG